MKKVSLLMLSLCLLVSACKDKDAPKSPEEVKEAAIERVQDFLEDLYDKDVDGNLDHCLLIISGDEKYEEEYPFPGTAYRAALQHNVEYSPKDFVYNENVKEFHTKDHLDYVRVETKYKGRKIWFNLYFDGCGKTGTEGEATIISTAGLYKYDNDAFKKKAGFSLIYDETYDDLTPYLQRWGALHSVDEVKAYLRKVKRTDIQVISVKLSDDWLSQINNDKVSRYEVNCTDGVKFFITDKHEGKYKITKIQGLQQPPSSFKESVEGIHLNDRYDETLEKLKADPENKKRGMATDPDKTTIGVFQKTYHGVVFDFVYFSFSVDAISAIELRKTANVYDNNPQEIINSAYNRISKELKDKLSVVESESSDEIVFRDGCSVIKVCKSLDSMTEEYELTVKIEHD